jgi:Right handed beta helix region
MDRRRRSFLAGGAAAGAALVAPGGSALAQAPTFTPEQFGAKGDGLTNDTAAFRALAEAVNRAGGGTVELRRTTYILGQQAPAAKADSLYYFQPAPLLEFVKCSKPLVIRGNGAVLRCAPGLRYGLFDQAGRPSKRPMPYVGPGVASPYQFMIKADRCTGPVSISNLEIDGNLPRLQIGGQYGDTGWQIPHCGIGLFNNRGDEIVENVHCHHHGMDGVTIDGDDSAIRPLPRRLITGLVSDYNGRQGCSIVGGRGYAFSKCKFNRTGRSAVESNPGSGVDIEAEGKLNRDFSFTDCEFIDNAGAGMVADSGDSEGATFTRCLFVGTTMWSAWPNKPRFRFDHCRFVGTLVRAYGDKDPQRAAQFHDCLFLDDPKLSPTGKVFLAGKENYPIVDLAEGVNVLFDRCTFRLTHKGLLPWTWYAIYANVRMDQAAPMEAYPKGRYLGSNVINGKVDLYGSKIEGKIALNGR